MGGERMKAKTHCKHGHPFDESNTSYYRSQRVCRACKRLAYHRHKQLNKGS